MVDLRVGVVAPDLELLDDAARPVKLSVLRGKWVVLTFYAEDDTPVCSVQVCGLRDEFSAFKKLGALVFAVSSDPVTTHEAWRAKEKLPFQLLSDPGNAVASRYGAHGEKSMYGRTVIGVIRTTVIVDPSGRIAVLQRKIRSKGHGARVVVALREAQAAYAERR